MSKINKHCAGIFFSRFEIAKICCFPMSDNGEIRCSLCRTFSVMHAISDMTADILIGNLVCRLHLKLRVLRLDIYYHIGTQYFAHSRSIL